MPGIARAGDLCTGHGCFPSRPGTTTSTSVFINGLSVHRLGDKFDVHCCGKECHDGIISSSSSTVFVEGIALARIGDPISCGSMLGQGSPNVFSG